MTGVSKHLKADLYKFYHSKIIVSHLIIPILGIVIMLAYYIISLWSELEKISAYFQIVAMAFPLIISIIVTMAYEQEEETKGFQYFLSTPGSRLIPHFSKLILLLILGFISTIIAIAGFGVLFKYIGNSSIGISLYLKAAYVMFISNIPLYMLQYLIVFYFGKGASIGLGIVGSLISALMLTGIGDGIWFVLPWGYSIRLSSYFFQYEMIDHIGFMAEGQMRLAIVSMLIYIVIFLFIQWIFSCYWEGRKGTD